MATPADLPLLLAALRQPTGGLREALAVVQGGPAAIPLLIDAATDAEVRVRGLACVALGLLPSSVSVVRALRLRLDDDSHEVRAVAARALGSLKAGGDDILQRLAQLRQADPSPATRDAAEEALLAILGTPASPTQPIDQLVRAFAAADPEAREEAIASVGRLGSDTLTTAQQASVQAALRERLLEDASEQVRMSAALALWKHGRAPVPVIDALITALADPHPLVQTMAAQVLGNFGDRAARARPALEALATGSNGPTLAALARRSIQRIGSQA